MLVSSIFATTINIAVAANVSYAMKDLKKEFKKAHPNVELRVTLGSSGKLTAQIKNGAPYQLFMSANMNYPNALYSEKIAITKPVVYAQGALVYLSSKKEDFSSGMRLLESSKISKIAIANPKTAPYGKASVEAMKNAKIYSIVKPKLIYAESISQTVSYTIIAADIGFIAKSSLFTPQMSMYKKGINYEDVDISLYTPINQGIVVLKNGDNSEVMAFYEFMLSDKAKEILKNYGYLVP
ncbi:MAG: molybdate ABC transporter substrate-binding protein [Campylobacterota bacterium]|nr:molybdate ABC transporter substrate-binding protein [Campylobacterota bacterium]